MLFRSLLKGNKAVVEAINTSMYTEVTGVLVQSLQSGDIGGALHYLIHPFDGPHHLVPLSLGEDWGAFVL